MQIHRSPLQSSPPLCTATQKSLSQTARPLRKQQNIKNWIEFFFLNKQNKEFLVALGYELSSTHISYFSFIIKSSSPPSFSLPTVGVAAVGAVFVVVFFFQYKAIAFVCIECYSSLSLLVSPWIAFFLLQWVGTGYWMLSLRRAFRVNQLIYMRKK